MTRDDILQQRLRNQQLGVSSFRTPKALVQYFGAMQAQDFGAARWGVGLRLAEARDCEVEDAFARGEILRTHVMRPTWHFVAAEDIRWLLALTAARVKVAARSYQSALGLDEAILDHVNRVLIRALQGGMHLTRPEIAAELQRAGINQLTNISLGHMLMNAELDAVICSGPRCGKQVTYALLDERVPSTPALQRDEALAELTRRYFTSHGPATLRDFAWWSGLTVADGKRGVALNHGLLEEHTVDDQTYWSIAPVRKQINPQQTHLLPTFDEYAVAYTSASRELLFEKCDVPSDLLRQQTPVPLTNVVVKCGRVIGSWRRLVDKGQLRVVPTWFHDGPPPPDLDAAVQRYTNFLDAVAEPSFIRA